MFNLDRTLVQSYGGVEARINQGLKDCRLFIKTGLNRYRSGSAWRDLTVRCDVWLVDISGNLGSSEFEVTLDSTSID
jgi:hypothetical protein